MWLPDKSVLMPLTPLIVTRGNSIQKAASSTISPSALLSILAVTTTFVKSFESFTLCTRPILTSL